MSAGISSISVTMGFGSTEGDPVTADILSLANGDRFIVLRQVGLSLIVSGVEREAAANARQIALALKAVAEELEWTPAKPVQAVSQEAEAVS